MRILLLTLLYPLPTNLARGTFVHERATLLRSMGHDVRVVNPLPRMLKMHEIRRTTLTGVARAPKFFEIGKEGVYAPRFIKLPRDPLPWLTRKSIRGLTKKVQEWLGDWLPEAISCHTIWPVAELAESLAEKYEIPWWVNVHGHDFDVSLQGPLSNHIKRLALASTQLIVASERLAKIGIEQKPAIDSIFIPCHTEVDKEWQRQIKKWNGRWRRDKLEVLFPADPRRPEKRYVLALKACSELGKRGWDVHIGGLSLVSKSKVFDRMISCDVALITSRREVGPIVAREAIICGLPVASVNVGDLAAWLPKDCISIDESPQAIADAVEAALKYSNENYQIPKLYLKPAVILKLEEMITQIH